MVVIISKRVQKPDVIVMYATMDIPEDFNHNTKGELVTIY